MEVSIPDMVVKTLINTFAVFDGRTVDYVIRVYMNNYKTEQTFDEIRDEVEEILQDIFRDEITAKYLEKNVVKIFN